MMIDRRHTIRLWGPWQVQALPASDNMAGHESRLNFKSLESEVEPPWSEEFANKFVGTLTLSRKFNCPTGLDPNQKVTLEIEGFEVTRNGTVQLNSFELGPTDGLGLRDFELKLREGSNQIDLVFTIEVSLANFRLPPFKVMQLCIDG